MCCSGFVHGWGLEAERALFSTTKQSPNRNTIASFRNDSSPPQRWVAQGLYQPQSALHRDQRSSDCLRWTRAASDRSSLLKDRTNPQRLTVFGERDRAGLAQVPLAPLLNRQKTCARLTGFLLGWLVCISVVCISKLLKILKGKQGTEKHRKGVLDFSFPKEYFLFFDPELHYNIAFLPSHLGSSSALVFLRGPEAVGRVFPKQKWMLIE